MSSSRRGRGSPLRGAGAERGELVRDGSRSSALPAIADVATAPPPSRGEKQSERFRRRRGAGSEAGAGPPRLPAPLGSPPSARRPPLPTRTSRARSGWDSPAPRPGPRAPRLLTPSSLSAPAAAGRGPRGGEVGSGEPPGGGGSRAPRPGYLLPRPARGHRDDLDRTPKPFISPPREVTRSARVRTGVRDLRGGDRRRWESFFPETIQNPARFLRPPGGFLREDNPQQLLFSQTWLFLSRRGDHVPRAPRAATHPNTQPRGHSPGGGERPRPPLSGARVLRGRLTCRAPGPHRDSSCRLGRKCGENRLATGNNRMARCLRLHPLFRKVLIAPVHPQAGRSTGLWSFKNPLRLRRENCPGQCLGDNGFRLAGIILNGYQQVRRHRTPAVQPAQR